MGMALSFCKRICLTLAVSRPLVLRSNRERGLSAKPPSRLRGLGSLTKSPARCSPTNAPAAACHSEPLHPATCPTGPRSSGATPLVGCAGTLASVTSQHAGASPDSFRAGLQHCVAGPAGARSSGAVLADLCARSLADACQHACSCPGSPGAGSRQPATGFAGARSSGAAPVGVCSGTLPAVTSQHAGLCPGLVRAGHQLPDTGCAGVRSSGAPSAVTSAFLCAGDRSLGAVRNVGEPQSQPDVPVPLACFPRSAFTLPRRKTFDWWLPGVLCLGSARCAPIRARCVTAPWVLCLDRARGVGEDWGSSRCKGASRCSFLPGICLP